jgi:hypothetical protein
MMQYHAGTQGLQQVGRASALKANLAVMMQPRIDFPPLVNTVVTMDRGGVVQGCQGAVRIFSTKLFNALYQSHKHKVNKLHCQCNV